MLLPPGPAQSSLMMTLRRDWAGQKDASSTMAIDRTVVFIGDRASTTVEGGTPSTQPAGCRR